jgi:sarcosine oxidase / L-pipecolate oxidase
VARAVVPGLAKHGAGVPVTSPKHKREVTEADVEETREFLRGSLPALADAPVVATRQCWYGDALDGDFLIDAHPTREGLFVVGGDSGHAFKFAPVMGGLIADVVERRENPWAERFRWREPRATKEAARAK